MRLVQRLSVLFCLFYNTSQISLPEDDSYVAAVLEYAFVGTTDGNLENYLQFIEDAAQQNADIVVFPELTLSRRDPIEVPIYGELVEYSIPALWPDFFHKVLVSISQAARTNAIYVVINIEESVNCTVSSKEYCPEERTYLFNTNVVFDRNGAVIDRYRKINLFGEFSRTPALRPDLGIFTTDFGVTFGHFICFDLLFQVPALQLVENMNVTDIIFPTMWFSELPYLTAVQIQESYAYEMNVNFLASGANNVRVGSAGSGIYSGKAGALVSTTPGLPASRLLVSRVPKIPGQVTFPTNGPIYDSPADHDSLVLISDPSLPSHVTRRLVAGLQEFTLLDHELTCAFRINITENQPADGIERYNYRAAAFSGIRSYSGVATGGVRICSIFACTGESIDTCGRRFPEYNPKTTSTFNELKIIATVTTPIVEDVVGARDTVYFPLSVDTSIMPLEPENYIYNEETIQNVTVYTLNLNKHDVDLYSFAIWGRVFEGDGEDADPPLEEAVEEIQEAESILELTTRDPGDGSVNHLLAKILLIPAVALMFWVI